MEVLRWLFGTSPDHGWPPDNWPPWLVLLHLAGRAMIAFSCWFLPLAFYLSAKRSRPDSPRYHIWQALSAFLVGVGTVVGLTPAMEAWPAYRFLGILGFVVGLIGTLWTIPATVRYMRWLSRFVPPELLEETQRRAESAEQLARAKTREAGRLVAQVRELQERCNTLPGSDLADLQETAEALRRLVAG